MEDDDSDEDTFVVIGTALSTYDEDEAPKKQFTVQEQSVKDSKGRVRFHGAFTGGYSAGYFNTVGSKEGFTPSLFVSSKEKKNEKQSQRPEDFMDDEDFGEHGIAPKKVSATDDFNSESRKRKDGIDGSDPLRNLIVPTSASIGLKLLRQLGWRDGQGIGPRVHRKRKTKSKGEEKKVYGCALPGQDRQDSSENDEDFLPQNVTFAPKDVNPIKFQAKDDLHGLGYSGINPRSVLGGTGFSLFEDQSGDQRKSTVRSKGKVGITGQAFGVGEYEDEDDVNIYAGDSMSNYDTVLGGPTADRNHGWTAPKYKGLSSAPVGYIGKVIEGFKVSKENLNPKKYFPPPELPRKFKPFHVRETEEKEEESLGVDRKSMNANVRRNMLGEVKSVFDLIPSSDKAKMEAAKKQAPLATAKIDAQSLKSRFEPSSNSTSKPNEATSSQTQPLYKGPHTFKPFAKEPAKQARYEQYLENKRTGNKDEIPLGSMTEWERQKESDEFARSARLYKPMSSLMASRFITAKYDDQDDKVEIPAEDLTDKNDQKKAAEMNMFGKLTRDHYEWHPDKLLCKRFNVANPYPDSTMVGVPKVKRDKYSVFNFLNNPTASEVGGVEEQEDEVDIKAIEMDTSEVKKKASKMEASFKPLAILASDDHGLQSTDTNLSSQDNTSDMQTGKSATSLEVNTEPAEKARPSMDIFKAIFSDSDDDSSSSSESDKEEESQESSQKTVDNKAGGSGTKALLSIFGKQSASILAKNISTQGTIPIESLEERLSPKLQDLGAANPVDRDRYSKHSLSIDEKTNNSNSRSKDKDSTDYVIESLPQPPGSYIQVKDDESMWTERVLSSDEEKSSKKKHSKHKHKTKKKKSKHKKHKKKTKKERKKKKKKQDKKEVIIVSSDSSSSGSQADEDSSSSDSGDIDKKLFDRLKSVQSNKRPTAADFM